MTLVEFLRARLGEDERWAQDERRTAVKLHGPAVLVDPHEYLAGLSSSLNVAARVLAEVAAKRRIVDLHGEWIHECVGNLEHAIAYDPYIGCTTLRLLALPYAEHPDYSADWAPHSM